MTEKQIKRRLARIRHVAALLAALMMSYHSPTLDTWVATRLRLHQHEAAELHRKMHQRGGRSKRYKRRKHNGKGR
jgi:hypothetical protein